jgi:hypothetical protein
MTTEGAMIARTARDSIVTSSLPGFPAMSALASAGPHLPAWYSADGRHAGFASVEYALDSFPSSFDEVGAMK